MTRASYAIFILLPVMITCWVIGKPAKYIEIAAKKVRLKCVWWLKKVLDSAPEMPDA